jgi:hypothetical protein
MSSSVNAILLYLFLYALYVLLPLIPAVIIFKLFPNTQVAVNGPLSGFTVNATGAFGAYLVTVLLGYSIVANAGALIADMVPTTWKVHVKIKLQDRNNQPLSKQASIASMAVNFQPELLQTGTDSVHVTVPVERPGDWPTIQFDMAGFEQGIVDLREAVNNKKVTIDSTNREITLIEPIPLTALGGTYENRAYNPPATELRPSLTPTQAIPGNQ